MSTAMATAHTKQMEQPPYDLEQVPERHLLLVLRVVYFCELPQAIPEISTLHDFNNIHYIATRSCDSGKIGVVIVLAFFAIREPVSR